MLLAALRVLRIKDLKDLSLFFVGVTIDMQDLKDLKRCFHASTRGGQAPALRYPRGFSGFLPISLFPCIKPQLLIKCIIISKTRYT